MGAEPIKIIIMKHTVNVFEGAGRVSLYSQYWMPDESPRALMAVVHGVTEHSARYANMVALFLSAQIGVCGFDLRGHGRSSGRRGHIDRWQDYSTDLGLFLHSIRTSYPGLPVFLFGHSLGALIVLSHLTAQPTAVNGAIICGAAIEPVGVARPHLVALARIFSFFWPTFSIPLRPQGRITLSRDPRVEADFLADPLVLKRVTARFGTEALAMIASVKRHAPTIRLPLLAIHGGVDPLSTVAGVQKFFHEVNSADKRMLIYPDSYHEPHNDLDRDQVLADVREWIESHV